MAPNKMSCEVIFYPAPTQETGRNTAEDASPLVATENYVLVLYVKKENHPMYSKQISQLRSEIARLQAIIATPHSQLGTAAVAAGTFSLNTQPSSTTSQTSVVIPRC